MNGNIKFSMNGFRRQLSNDAVNLRDIASAILKDDYYDKEEFIKAVNTIITHSNVINCTFQKDDPNFVDMSDLDIELLEQSN